MTCVILFYLFKDEILENYGYIGAYTYNEILAKFKDFKSKPETFLINLVEFYHKNIEQNSCEALKNLQAFLDIFESKIDLISDIIQSGILNKKEIPLIKIIFDILIHKSLNMDKFNSKLFTDKIIPISISFYSDLSEKDIKFMKNFLNKNKITKEFLSKKIKIKNLIDEKLRALLSDKKAKYLRFLVKLKIQHSLLFKGIEKNNFFL